MGVCSAGWSRGLAAVRGATEEVCTGGSDPLGARLPGDCPGKGGGCFCFCFLGNLELEVEIDMRSGSGQVAQHSRGLGVTLQDGGICWS